MSTLVKNILRFSILILVQYYVLDKVHLHYTIIPYIYFLFILWMPFRFSKPLQLVLAFLLGAALDAFRHHPGFHAAACVLIAYLRPFFISILIPQEGADSNYEEPSLKSLGGFIPYLFYVGVLSFIHNTWLFLLEALQFGNFLEFLFRTLFSTIISVGLILVAELLFSRKQKFKTNTV